MKFFSWKKSKTTKKKQQVMFEQALAEIGKNISNSTITIDHPGACNYFNGSAHPIIFPMEYLRRVNELQNTKAIHFSFVGVETEKRIWVQQYLNFNKAISCHILFTEKGRQLKTFDEDYYTTIKSSKFVLCPAGDFLWTYRFYEAIMCRSIPVIRRGEEHPSYDGFFYLYHEDIKECFSLVEQLEPNYYDIVSKNYILFLDKHTLLKELIGTTLKKYV